MEREKAAQAKLRPHGQMLAQWRPRPQGCQGSSVLGIQRGERPELAAEVRGSSGALQLASTGLRTAFPRPLGGVGGGLSAGSSTLQMKTRPGNWLVAVQLQGDLLLPKVPSQSRGWCSKRKSKQPDC